MVSTSLDIAIKQLKIVAVLRPKNYNLAAAHMAVNYARAATNELGGRQKKYDVPGVLSSAISWKTAIVITPLLSLKIAPAATDAIFGSDASFFCSELVTQSYESAGTPIIPIKPQNVVPGAIYFSTNLTRVGFLRYMV